MQQYGTVASFFTSVGPALIAGAGQVSSAVIIGRSGVQAAQVSADAQAAQSAASYQAQLLDKDFGETTLSYLPQLALLGAATLVAVVAIKTFSE